VLGTWAVHSHRWALRRPGEPGSRSWVVHKFEVLGIAVVGPDTWAEEPDTEVEAERMIVEVPDKRVFRRLVREQHTIAEELGKQVVRRLVREQHTIVEELGKRVGHMLA
jgi:hypothetical protein